MNFLWAVFRAAFSQRSVSLLLITLTGAANCQDQEPARVRYAEPVRLASLADPQIVESSGLGASWRNPGLYWTHNDSGGGPFVYAFDRSGAARGTWLVQGAEALDWEDMAVGPGPEPKQSYLYLADFGDNQRIRREVIVYRVLEPEVPLTDSKSTDAPQHVTETTETIRLRYPAGASHNAEALLVHPANGDLYVVTKPASESDPGTLVFRAAAPVADTAPIVLQRVAALSLPNIRRQVWIFSLLWPAVVTGGDISPDGRRVILSTYGGGFELTLPEGAAFDQIWHQPPVRVPLGEQLLCESVCYRRDGQAILAGSEGPNSPIYEIIRQEWQQR